MNAMEEKIPAEVYAENALGFVLRFVCSYTMLLEQTYGFLKAEGKQALHFSEGGKMRAASILGYIAGLAEAGQQASALKFAADIMREFDYLAAYGGTFEHPLNQVRATGEPRKLSIPAYYVELGDDGSRHGFSIMWYKFRGTLNNAGGVQSDVLKEYQERPQSFRIAKYGFDQYAYRFCMNGGLIYHGPGKNAFSVNLSDSGHLWSIHT